MSLSRTITSLDALRKMLPEPLCDALTPHARIVTRQVRQVILGFGDQTSDVFLILEGTARATLHSPDGREVILGDLGPGQLFGELAALDGQRRTATVEATTACVLASFPGGIFRSAVFAHPETADWIARQLVGQIRLLTEKLFELNALAVRSRLHCELLRLSLASGIADNRSVIAQAPTHVQLASRIGTHREAVTRELQYLLRQGIVAQDKRELVVNDVARLTQLIRVAAGDVDVIHRAAPAFS